MYLKVVDKFQSDLYVHCLVTPSNARFLLLHENRSEDQIKAFFNEVYELYTKLVLNPFFDPQKKI